MSRIASCAPVIGITAPTSGLMSFRMTNCIIAFISSSRRVWGGMVIVTASTPAASRAVRLRQTGSARQVRRRLGDGRGRPRRHAGELYPLRRLDEGLVEVTPARTVVGAAKSGSGGYRQALRPRRFEKGFDKQGSRCPVAVKRDGLADDEEGSLQDP
jgi:hypothetical protein